MRPALDLDQDPLEPSPFRGQHVLDPHRSLRIHMLMAIILVKRRMQKVAFMDQKGGWEFEFALMVAADRLTSDRMRRASVPALAPFTIVPLSNCMCGTVVLGVPVGTRAVS